MTTSALDSWHKILASKCLTGLEDLIADDAVFHSPLVHRPQEGKDLTFLYLAAAFEVLANDSFHYVRQVVDGQDAVLEFVTEVDQIIINGVDMITWNAEGKIVDFKVMLRPLKAISLVQQKMAAKLEFMSSKSP